MDADTVISARSVGKLFRLPHDRHSTVRDHLLHPPTRHRPEAFPALRDVSFEVRAGEFMAVIGRNGSGKSTLLRCMAGIYPLDTGQISVRGRVAPFIELGVGFNAELSARDNLITSGMLIGLSARQVRARYQDMLRFAELERFADLKFKNYSSGMAMRLGFSLTTHTEADIMLFDEVIAVGDLAFRRKCFQRFEELKREGRTLVLVTHDMSVVRQLCDRALLLDRGELVGDGDPDTVCDQYESLNLERPPMPRPSGPRRRRARCTRSPPDRCRRRARCDRQERAGNGGSRQSRHGSRWWSSSSSTWMRAWASRGR